MRHKYFLDFPSFVSYSSLAVFPYTRRSDNVRNHCLPDLNFVVGLDIYLRLSSPRLTVKGGASCSTSVRPVRRYRHRTAACTTLTGPSLTSTLVLALALTLFWTAIPISTLFAREGACILCGHGLSIGDRLGVGACKPIDPRTDEAGICMEPPCDERQ